MSLEKCDIFKMRNCKMRTIKKILSITYVGANKGTILQGKKDKISGRWPSQIRLAKIHSRTAVININFISCNLTNIYKSPSQTCLYIVKFVNINNR
jgi:hypothetical protein